MIRRLALGTVAGHFCRHDFSTFFLRHGPAEFCQVSCRNLSGTSSLCYRNHVRRTKGIR